MMQKLILAYGEMNKERYKSDTLLSLGVISEDLVFVCRP